MCDPRLVRMAQVLVGYSLEISAGDRFIINAPSVAPSLFEFVSGEALFAGA